MQGMKIGDVLALLGDGPSEEEIDKTRLETRLNSLPKHIGFVNIGRRGKIKQVRLALVETNEHHSRMEIRADEVMGEDAMGELSFQPLDLNLEDVPIDVMSIIVALAGTVAWPQLPYNSGEIMSLSHMLASFIKNTFQTQEEWEKECASIVTESQLVVKAEAEHNQNKTDSEKDNGVAKTHHAKIHHMDTVPSPDLMLPPVPTMEQIRMKEVANDLMTLFNAYDKMKSEELKASGSEDNEEKDNEEKDNEEGNPHQTSDDCDQDCDNCIHGINDR